MHLESQYFSVNGQNLHVKLGGCEDGPVLLMLHGFPEYWVGWAEVAQRLQEQFRVVLPDQRGYNLSSKPAELEAYDAKHLAEDMAGLIEQISPDSPVVVCGHDWGASVAYMLAMRHAHHVSHLVIANGVHPICFQKALLAGGPQTQASQYIHKLRKTGIETALSANNYQKLIGMFEAFSSAPWLTDSVREEYRAAWSKPGALTAMLNWYRQSSLAVPTPDAASHSLQIDDNMREKYHISAPHLLLWGNKDTALLPESYENLEEFCSSLSVQQTHDASHWILHEKPDWIAQNIREFLNQSP